MLLRDLTKVWVSEYEEIKEHGEPRKKWKYKGIVWLNLQQDVNELDRNSAGETDYSIVNGRTTFKYDIQKSNGISLTDISNIDSFIPDYTVSDNPETGNTTLYKLKQYNGEVEDNEY